MAEGTPTRDQDQRPKLVAPGAPKRPRKQENVADNLHNLNLENGKNGVARRLEFGDENNN